MFLLFLGWSRSRGERDSSAWHCSPLQPPVTGSACLTDSRCQDATASLHEAQAEHRHSR